MLDLILQWDSQMSAYIQEHLRFEWLEPVMRFFANKSNLVFVAVPVLPVLFWRNWKRTLCFLAVLGICIGMTDQTAYQFKKRVDRLRPNQMELPVAERRNTESFPSAHSANITGAFFVIRYFYPLFTIPMAGIALFVITGRVFLNSHYPTDALGGVVVGVLAAAILLKILLPYFMRRFPKIQQWIEPKYSGHIGA